ncbi:MAG: SPFH domain-containing protein [Actinomycetota bacterium]|nr:SPFH domain-containing protein [Actinomycetota bacterium]
MRRRLLGGAAAGSLVLAALIWFGSASIEAVPPDKVLLHYTGGPFQGTHFKEVIPPGTGTQYYGQLEHLYYLPSTQRTYVISRDKNASDNHEVDFITAPANDNTPFTLEATVNFKLNQNPVYIRQFFEQICLHDNCTDLSPGGGWDKMLATYFRPQIIQSVSFEAKKYSRDQLYKDGGVLNAINSAVAQVLADRINQVVGGPFFCGPDSTPTNCLPMAVTIQNPTPPQKVIDAYASNAASQQEVLTSTNQAASKVAAAKGDADAQAARAAAPSLTQPQIDYIRAQAEQACATNNNCTLIVDGTGGGTNVNVTPKK